MHRPKSSLRSLARTAIALAVFAALAAACGKPDADKRLIYGSSKDIDAFFRQAHVQVKLADCENIRVNAELTRGFSCTTKINAEAFRLMSARFELAKGQPDPGEGKEGRCEWRNGFNSQNSNTEIWRAHWTCETKGQPFNYLEVRLAENGDACVEVFPQACGN